MYDYEFYNANPYGELEEDCVCRAIKTAFNMPYFEVAHKLFLIGDLYNCEPLSVCCYSHLLEDVFGLERQYADGQTVGDIANEFNDYIVLIRINGHLTVSKYGTVKDIWDCTNEIADIFWIVE